MMNNLNSMLESRQTPGGWRSWLMSLGLCLFFMLPFWTHFLMPFPGEERSPTGFIQYDMPYYMANATEHFSDGFDLVIPNPASPMVDSPRLYCFPQNILLGTLHRFTGWPAGVVWVVFGVVAGTIFFRTALALFAVLHEQNGRDRLGRWLFCLGGGVLFLGGFAHWLFYLWRDGSAPTSWWWTLDVGEGLWFLNLGRNALYPHESYYHALVLGTMYFVVKERWWAALGLSALTAASHPFTGIGLLCALLGWKGLDAVLPGARNKVPWAVALGWLGLLVGMLSYYKIFLPGFPEHRDTAEQWMQAWLISYRSMIPADILVGVPALVRLYREFKDQKGWTTGTKMLLAWFIASSLLANHELFMKPMQPVHFTRGYMWIPLFLLGWPVLGGWIRSLGGIVGQGGRLRRALPAMACGLFCLDNLVFIPWYALTFTPLYRKYDVSEMAVIEVIEREAQRSDLFVPPYAEFGTLALAVADCRSWLSNSHQTPYFHKREQQVLDFWKTGAIPEEWKGRVLWLCAEVGEKDQQSTRDRVAQSFARDSIDVVCKTKRFILLKVTPGETRP